MPTDASLVRKRKLYKIIYEADTPAGKWFDILLIVFIITSVIAVMLDSVDAIGREYQRALYLAEWFFTIAFTIEYAVRIYCHERPSQYVLSFFGMVDLLSVIPTYLSLLLPGANYLLVIRVIRTLRIFRILKLVQHTKQANLLVRAIISSRQKITVFLFSVSTMVVVFGALMYLIEGPTNGYTSIPKSIYWAVVTLTTVGYGDISPQTPFGQAVSALIMIIGYSIIAVPTGIFTAELAQVIRQDTNEVTCPRCKKRGHDPGANYCNHCGSQL